MGNTISGQGGTTIYFRQVAPDSFQFSQNNITWTTIYFPLFVSNITPNDGNLKVIFVGNITFTNASYFFICNSNNIQFGSETLNNDGNMTEITIDVDNYNGLVDSNGYSNISIYNIFVNGSGHFLNSYSGWIGQSYFGSEGSDNYIINCRSAGDISASSGGIVGSSASAVTIIGCSSSGEIFGSNAGGIVGETCGNINYVVNVSQCHSIGNISGDGAGGIVGGNCYNANITNCYTLGAINADFSAGGIIGQNAGLGQTGCNVSACFSYGVIDEPNGGIVGKIDSPSSNHITCTVTNCYTTGDMVGNITNGGGIISKVNTDASGNWNVIVSNCYTTGLNTSGKGFIVGGKNTVNGTDTKTNGTIFWTNNYSEAFQNTSGWSNVHANIVLTGTPTPTIGTTWSSINPIYPYFLTNMGYTPYSRSNIASNTLAKNATYNLYSGNFQTPPALVSDLGYVILGITAGDSRSYDTFSINSITGVISASYATNPGTYIVYVLNGGYDYSYYNISTYIITTMSSYEGSHIGLVSLYKVVDDVINRTTLTIEWSSLAGSVVYLVEVYSDYNNGNYNQLISSKDISGVDQDNVTQYSYDVVFDTSDPELLGLRSVVVTGINNSDVRSLSRIVHHQ